MGQGISEVLPFAVGVGISPVPIVAVVLLFLVFGTVLVAKGLGLLST
jgi:hypothetical protein